MPPARPDQKSCDHHLKVLLLLPYSKCMVCTHKMSNNNFSCDQIGERIDLYLPVISRIIDLDVEWHILCLNRSRLALYLTGEADG